jgi:hypothetical protein
MTFKTFVAIDWSGAKSAYARKLRVAQCEQGTAAPKLIEPANAWTRQAIVDWLKTEIFPKTAAIIGFDFSFAPPFIDQDAYLPGFSRARSAKDFWAELDEHCTDPDLGAAGFLQKHRGRFFYLGAADGDKKHFMRLRACEMAFNATGGGKPSSVFDAIGAAQVAKASFAGMRVLNQLKHHAPIWPFDRVEPSRSVVVEIYCRAFIRHAGLRGLKLRDLASLNNALSNLGSAPIAELARIDDDISDALIASAGLRALAGDSRFWQPAGLTKRVACTEGWTFGVL